MLTNPHVFYAIVTAFFVMVTDALNAQLPSIKIKVKSSMVLSIIFAMQIVQQICLILSIQLAVNVLKIARSAIPQIVLNVMLVGVDLGRIV